jgi:hypothetical protein
VEFVDSLDKYLVSLLSSLEVAHVMDMV